MDIPYRPVLFGISVNVHLIFEYLAFFTAFRFYLFLRKSHKDTISYANRLSIIVGAILGALVGSRLVGFLENPILNYSEMSLIQLFNMKTIMGGLFGGLLGVEVTKMVIGEQNSSGDLFTYPIILGIFIGRIGCFLSGTDEFTYGSETSFVLGMDLGDGLIRHPIALYELFFLIIFYLLLRRAQRIENMENGWLFQFFMIGYFGFRFFIEFIKPNAFLIAGLSSIQWLCVVCWIYYRKTFIKIAKYAY